MIHDCRRARTLLTSGQDQYDDESNDQEDTGNERNPTTASAAFDLLIQVCKVIFLMSVGTVAGRIAKQRRPLAIAVGHALGVMLFVGAHTSCV
jgi:hypothetical protein